jgi:hypothetical protein
MRKLLLAIFGLMLLVAPALAQQQVSLRPDCVIPFSFTAPGQTTPVAGGVGDYRYTACTKWTLRYYSRGFSAISLDFKHADDNGGIPGSWNTWGTSGGTLASGSSLPLTATTSGQATGYKYRPWVMVQLNSATGTGIVEGVLEGWRPFGGSDDGNGGGSTTNLTQVGSASIALGQGAMAVSLPVAIASNQSAVPVSGSVTVAQATGSNLHAVLDANSGVDIGKLTANQSVNAAQVNGVATATGTGAMGTGVQRVAIASDNDPVTVKQATGSNLHAVTDTGSTTAVTQATGSNLHAVTDTGSTTAVTQATSSNLNADVNVKNINGIVPLMGNGNTGTGSQRVTIAADNTAFTVNAAESGTWTVQPGNTANTTPWLVTARIVGNAGGIVDFAGQNAASPASALLHGCQFNTTPSTISSGNASPCQVNSKGQLLVTTIGPGGSINCVVGVSTATTIQAVGTSCAAPGAGLSIYITDIEFGTSAAAGTAADSFPTLKSGTGGTCGTGVAIIWQALTGANTTVIANLTQPIKVAANSEVCWIMSTAGSKTIQIHGFIAP